MIKFIRARYPELRRTRKIIKPRVVVLHSSEWPQRTGAARACAEDWASPQARMASAHYVVDDTEVVQAMPEDEAAWHAPPLNRCAIGVELTAHAAFCAEDWRTPYSTAMLELAAGLVAGVCERHAIPACFITEQELVRSLGQASGITTHAEVSRAFHVSDHTDPGPAFPMEAFLCRVRQLFCRGST